MSNPEGGDEIVVGKDGAEGRDGSAGYMNAAERDEFEEANPELAAYSSLKFKVSDDEDEPSDEDRALSSAADMVVSAREETKQLRKQADGRELADGVGLFLDKAEEVVEEIEDWDAAEEFRRQSQVEALSYAVAIEDDELRQRTLAQLEERVDEDIYEDFAQQWQAAYAAQTERDMQEGWKQAQAEAEQQLKTYEAVVQLETDLLNQMSPLEQACALQLLEGARDEIAAAHPGAAQEMIRHRLEMARDAAAKIEAADTQMRIVKAHGRTKSGLSGRDLKEADLSMLGLLPDLSPTSEEVHAAHARAQKGVKIDREKGKRIHKGSGPTGMERLQAQTIARAKAMGVPVHDGATGRRIG